MSDNDFFYSGLAFGLFVGAILGVVIVVLAESFDTGKQKQTECKVSDGIKICREVDYFPWKVKETDK